MIIRHSELETILGSEGIFSGQDDVKPYRKRLPQTFAGPENYESKCFTIHSSVNVLNRYVMSVIMCRLIIWVRTRTVKVFLQVTLTAFHKSFWSVRRAGTPTTTKGYG